MTATVKPVPDRTAYVSPPWLKFQQFGGWGGAVTALRHRARARNTRAYGPPPVSEKASIRDIIAKIEFDKDASLRMLVVFALKAVHESLAYIEQKSIERDVGIEDRIGRVERRVL